MGLSCNTRHSCPYGWLSVPVWTMKGTWHLQKKMTLHYRADWEESRIPHWSNIVGLSWRLASNVWTLENPFKCCPYTSAKSAECNDFSKTGQLLCVWRCIDSPPQKMAEEERRIGHVEFSVEVPGSGQIENTCTPSQTKCACACGGMGWKAVSWTSIWSTTIKGIWLIKAQ